jgi:sRNA-binding carbon storage regulator CsrA
LHLGGDITVTLLAINGNKVGIGIKAPAHVPIVRMELGRPSVEFPGTQEDHREETDSANADR